MNKILLITAFFSFSIFASEPQFGRIVDIKGEGFISYKGKTREIRKGDAIEIGAEIVIEHHGQVSFTDNADHRFHLGNSSSASVSATTVELRSGDMWFQSLNKTDSYKVTTANALVDYQGGEAIVSYDSVKGKTQLMVINGMMKLSNLRATELNLSVGEGLFSFVDNAYEEGAPRDPTQVGEKTYGQLVSLFTGVSPMDKNSANIFKEHGKTEHTAATKVEHATRAIASVNDDSQKMIEEYKESMLTRPASKKNVEKKATVVKAVAKVDKVEKKKEVASKAVIHIYGLKSAPAVAKTPEVVPATKSRAPASVLDQEVPASSEVVSPYSKEYKQQYKESDKLIDDLKKL